MSTNLEVMPHPSSGMRRAIWSHEGGRSLHARVGRAMCHALVRFAACAAWLIALASIVSWATGYALEL